MRSQRTYTAIGKGKENKSPTIRQEEGWLSTKTRIREIIRQPIAHIPLRITADLVNLSTNLLMVKYASC